MKIQHLIVVCPLLSHVSDFFTKRLPSATKRRVSGIYRKYYDPMPEKRMRAFLKVLREWECHEESNDEKRYYLTMNKINGSRVFTDTSKHPFEDIGYKGDTPAGAYQINLITYRDFNKPSYGIGEGFSPEHQDRLAVVILEATHGQPLSLIRQGKISEAVNTLNRRWSSLPGGSQPRKEKRKQNIYEYTMDDLLNKYDEFMQDISGK